MEQKVYFCGEVSAFLKLVQFCGPKAGVVVMYWHFYVENARHGDEIPGVIYILHHLW